MEATRSKTSSFEELGTELDVPSFEEHIRCYVCKSTFRQPVILETCLHTFCFDCLKPLYSIDKETHASFITCPQCKQRCTEDKVSPNKLIHDLLKEQEQMEKNTKSNLKKYLDDIKELLQDIQRRIEAKEECVRELREYKAQFQDQLATVKKEVQERKEQLIEEIRSEFTDMVNVLETAEQEKLDFVDVNVGIQSREIKELQKFHSWGSGKLEKFAKETHIEELLLGIERLRFFSCRGANEDLVIFSKVEPQFVPGPEEQKLGTLSMVQGLPTVYGCMENPRLLSDDTLPKILGNFWKRENPWAIGGRQNITMAVRNEMYWLLEVQNYRLVTNVPGGNPNGNIIPLNTVTGVTDIRSFVITMFGDVIAVAAGGVYQLTADGTLICKVVAGEFVDVCSDGIFIHVLAKAASPSTAKVHTFKRTADQWVFHEMWDSKVTGADAIICTEDKVYLSSRTLGTIWICDLTTDAPPAKFGIKGSGTPGNLNHARISAVDRNGYVLVADTSNNRLQIMNPRGRWTVLTLETMDAPWDVFIEDENTMHMYSGSYGVLRYIKDKP